MTARCVFARLMAGVLRGMQVGDSFAGAVLGWCFGGSLRCSSGSAVRVAIVGTCSLCGGLC